uniref:Potassium/proton antiporter CemA n=1 Tax=Dipteris conjugata TaxID=32108 RepID=A0A0B5EEH2_9MONI|nr:chloroplast envelope membrane protein [Dipteris conjugata]
MKSYCWRLLRWFYNTPRRSPDRAYEASKRLQSVREDSSYYLETISSTEDSSQAAVAHTDAEPSKSLSTIYRSLLECRISISVSKIRNSLKFFIRRKQRQLLLIGNYPPTSRGKEISTEERSRDASPSHPPVALPLQSAPPLVRLDPCRVGRKPNIIGDLSQNPPGDNPLAPAGKYVSRESSKTEQMNRKLARIEATPNDPDSWTRHRPTTSPSLQINDNSNDKFSVRKSVDSPSSTTAYESISLMPRSITRTSSRFNTELTGQSSSLVLNDSELAKYQAVAPIQYIGCLLLLPSAIPIVLKNWFLEPRIRNWWNTFQSQIFINSFREEVALKRLQEIEGLLRLGETMRGSVYTQLQDYGTDVYDKTIQLVVICNEGNTQIISHLVTDVISIATSICLFIVGKKRLAVSNSWIRELFYSLNDTMKAFSTPPLTDLCIGFHSPHGWEIVVGSLLEHLGFAHNKYVISCFVSTFPVISDTVSKYRIFRHLNRISPSIVATHHTMNE